MTINLAKNNLLNSGLKIDSALFWDINIQTIEVIRDKRLIIERVCNRGSWDEFKQLVNFYGEEIIKNEIIGIKNLDKKTANFLSFYFKISISKFLCNRKNPSIKKLWNY